jgi:hypothetical protein
MPIQFGLEYLEVGGRPSEMYPRELMHLTSVKLSCEHEINLRVP